MKISVKEVANELHIGERAVQKKFSKYESELKPYLSYQKGKYVFDTDGLETLRNIGKSKQHKETTHEKIKEQSSQELMDEYKFLLNEYKEQIASLKAENEALKNELNLKWWQRLLPHKNGQ